MDFDNENRIISPDLEETDKDIELSLRPHTLNEYIGQEKAKENLDKHTPPPPKHWRRRARSCIALRTSRAR